MACEDCCRRCCYSTPYVTLGAVAFTIVGLLGFVLAGLYGVSELNTIPDLQNGTSVMAPVVSVVFVVTFLPLVLITIISYCITGYIRDILFQATIKKCIGSYCFNITIMVLTFSAIIVWLLLLIGLGGIMSFYIQLFLTCQDASEPTTCLSYVDSSFNRFLICGAELDEICPDAMTVGLSYSVSLLFAMLVVTGLILLLVLHATNFVNGRDYLDYRQNNTKDGFFFKQTR